jgi:hypothetical protein
LVKSQKGWIRLAYTIVVMWSRVGRMWIRRVIDSIDDSFCYGILIVYITLNRAINRPPAL